MNPYDYTASDIITILLMGGLFFACAYVVPIGVYLWGNEKVKAKQITFYTVFMYAIMFQLIALLGMFAIVQTYDILGGLSSLTSMKFSEAVASFFAVKWAYMNMDYIIESAYEANTLGGEVSIFLLIKTIWIILGFILVLFPFFILFMLLTTILLKYKEVQSFTSYEVIQDFFMLVVVTFALFAIHIGVSNIFLNSFYTSQQLTITKRAGDGNYRVPVYKEMVTSKIKSAYSNLASDDNEEN